MTGAHKVGEGIGFVSVFLALFLFGAWLTGAFDRPREPSAMDNCLETVRLVSGHAPTQTEVDSCVAAAR